MFLSSVLLDTLSEVGVSDGRMQRMSRGMHASSLASLEVSCDAFRRISLSECLKGKCEGYE